MSQLLLKTLRWSALMFKPINSSETQTSVPIKIFVDGKLVMAREGETLATALLNNEDGPFRRSAVSNSPRMPFCLMGACFECLVEVDGLPNVQACMIQVRQGMKVRRMQGARKAGFENE